MKVAVIVQLAILTLVKANSFLNQPNSFQNQPISILNQVVNPTTVHIKGCCNIRTLPIASGIKTISTGTFSTANVYCDMNTDNGGWTVIQRNRKNSQTSFNRSWKEYEEGFGRVHLDFWAGLKLIHALTQSGQWEMRMDYQKQDGNNNWEYLHYDHFRVESANNKYQLHLSGYTGEAQFNPFGDGRTANGTELNTSVNDTDLTDSEKCAALHNGGWWNCYYININRQPPIYGRQNVVLYTEMKIRPKDCIV